MMKPQLTILLSAGALALMSTPAYASNQIPAEPLGPPAGNWSAVYGDEFRSPIGNGSGQDNTWQPNYDSIGSECELGTDCKDEKNDNELQFFNSNQQSISAEKGLDLKCTYVAEGIKAHGEERKYRCGAVNASEGTGYKPFSYSVKEGAAFVFQTKMQLPLNTGEADPAFWAHGQEEFDFPEFDGWQTGFEKGKDWEAPNGEANWNLCAGSCEPGTERISFQKSSAEGFSKLDPPANPDESLHTYTTELEPIGGGKYSISTWIDGEPFKLKQGSAELNAAAVDHLILQYALRKCKSGCPEGEGNFTGEPRHTYVRYAAVYEDREHAEKGTGITNGGAAPGSEIAVKPINLTATAVSSTEIKATWNVTYPNSGLSGFYVKPPYLVANYIHAEGKTEWTHSFTGLLPETTYTINVLAWTGGNPNETPGGKASEEASVKVKTR
jgi:hypothetical protein